MSGNLGTSAVRTPSPALLRARQLLAQGRDLIDAVGHQAADAAADVLHRMEQASADTSELMEVNQALVPLMNGMRQDARTPRWWQWFTGERLEREVFFPGLQRQVENLAEQGERGLARLRRQADALATEDRRMAAEHERHQTDLEAAQLLLSPKYAGACRAAGLDDADLQRLARRATNLEAMMTASQLTRAQYKIAIDHAKSVADRFVEIRGLLLPLWKQAMGFELFSQRVAARDDAGT